MVGIFIDFCADLGRSWFWGQVARSSRHRSLMEVSLSVALTLACRIHHPLWSRGCCTVNTRSCFAVMWSCWQTTSKQSLHPSEQLTPVFMTVGTWCSNYLQSFFSLSLSRFSGATGTTMSSRYGRHRQRRRRRRLLPISRVSYYLVPLISSFSFVWLETINRWGRRDR